jgi:hypothetical protein
MVQKTIAIKIKSRQGHPTGRLSGLFSSSSKADFVYCAMPNLLKFYER